MRGADFSWGSRAWAGITDDDPGEPFVADPSAASLGSTARSTASTPFLSTPAALTFATMTAPAQAVVAPAAARPPVEAVTPLSRSSGAEAVPPAERTSHASFQPRASSVSLPPPAQRVTLRAPRFRIAPCALVGVCGQVGSGKSSLLAALLGELQPVPPRGYRVGDSIIGAPVVRGSVAYCQQIPWIEAGTVQDNIVFGAPFEEKWCGPRSAMWLQATLE
jgi:ABC-type multidrug transport system fused ATPase/permease subunit